MSVEFELNGKTIAYDGPADTPLLWVIRESAGLTGTKYGCGIAQCGACTVHLDGQARRSCVTPVSMVAGREITTIEGAASPAAKALQDAWIELDVPQCGFCQSGQLMSATALLEWIDNPSDEDIDGAMAGNICRCATYQRIRKAIKLAASRMGEKA